MGRDKDRLMNSAVSCVMLAWLMRYVLLAMRMYNYTCQGLALTDPLIITFIATSSIYVIFLLIQFGIMQTKFIVNFICYSKYMHPKYVTSSDGNRLITEFPHLETYKP